MKNVGIVTLYYKNYNYGGQLQAYALQRIISNLGYNCEQISFEWADKHHLQGCETSKSAMYFTAFSESILHSKRVYTAADIEECIDDYDIFVCGSDQIWGLPQTIPSHILPSLALSFVPESKIKIAYAASLGGAEVALNLKNILSAHVNSLDFVSVREKSSIPFVATMTNGEVAHVLDPTILLDKSEWDKIAVPPPEKAYILIYVLNTRDNNGLLEYAEALSQKSRYEIISLISDGCPMVGPKEFVGYIKHAKYFITNSFHGAVFAILYHVPFLVFPSSVNPKDPQSRDARMIALLDEFGFSSCFVYDTSSVTNIDDVIFHQVDETISAIRHNSIQFLKDALSFKKKL